MSRAVVGDSRPMPLPWAAVVVLMLVAICWTSPARADNRRTARAVGWAVGCGCTQTDLQTMVRYVGRIFFPDASASELKSLIGYVKSGEKESRIYDNSTTICSGLCYKTRDMFERIDDQIQKEEARG